MEKVHAAPKCWMKVARRKATIDLAEKADIERVEPEEVFHPRSLAAGSAAGEINKSLILAARMQRQTEIRTKMICEKVQWGKTNLEDSCAIYRSDISYHLRYLLPFTRPC